MYGIPEFARDEVKNARLIANPGCYPTAAQVRRPQDDFSLSLPLSCLSQSMTSCLSFSFPLQLPLVPLLKAGLITSEDIIIDAKSGTTGAGRSPKQVGD